MRCESLHGERSQRERDESLRKFKAGAAPVLLTSDLASRGLDIKRLPAIVNFDPPPTAASYVHRAGRTGRKGAAGLVVTLLRQDTTSRHLANQVSGLFRRAGMALPDALAMVLPRQLNEAARPPSASMAEQPAVAAATRAPKAKVAAKSKLASKLASLQQAQAEPEGSCGPGLMIGSSLLEFAAALAPA